MVMIMNKYVNEMEDYLYNHNYISRNKNKNPLRQQELSIERASCIVQKYRTLTEEKDKEIERLNNIIKPKEVNYNYLKLLFEKKDKEEVIKSYVYKCEQLEKLYKSYEEKEIEVMKKDNIINELEKWLETEIKFQKIIDKDYELRKALLKLKELKEGK